MSDEGVAILAAVVLTLVSGVGLGLPAALGMRSLARGRGVPTVFGFPAYGGGGFERAGVATTVPLLAAFLAVCLAELVAAALLGEGLLVGGWLDLALLVPGAVFWWGFDLPFPPVVAVARVALLWYGWGALK